MSTDPEPRPDPTADPAAAPAAEVSRAGRVDTVEAVVRVQMSRALGGRRGMVEAAVPTIAFTVLWLSTDRLGLSLLVSGGVAVVLLLVRLVQRSTPQFALNALLGIGIGWLFVRLAESRGGSEDEQALAYFLPGILYNGGYSVALALSCLAGWPLVGFMIGSVTGDPTGWRQDRQVVRLCTLLTWLLAVPCVLRVVTQGPVWLAGNTDALDADTAVAVLGVLKIAMGWPLQLAALGSMVWVLGRNRTPVAG